MKRTLLFVGLLMCVLMNSSSLKAQTQKGYLLVGTDVANFNVDFIADRTTFSMTIDPKVGFFIKNNIALGGFIDLGLTTFKGNTSVRYGVGVFGRYYFNAEDPRMMKRSCFFAEANAGFAGASNKVSGLETQTTNGIGLGIGPGWTYFITKNVGIEALFKYNIAIGFGDVATTNSLNLNIGFQIYLPGKRIKKQLMEDMDKNTPPPPTPSE